MKDGISERRGRLIVGPSGAGKTTLLSELGGTGFDLDKIGSREDDDDWKKWIIDVDRLETLRKENEPDRVFAGLGSNLDDVLTLDWRQVIMLFPTASRLRSNVLARLREREYLALPSEPTIIAGEIEKASLPLSEIGRQTVALLIQVRENASSPQILYYHEATPTQIASAVESLAEDMITSEIILP